MNLVILSDSNWDFKMSIMHTLVLLKIKSGHFITSQKGNCIDYTADLTREY